MMKTSILRQASLCRVALGGARRIQLASRSFPAVTALAQSSQVGVAQLRPLNAIRFYSAEAAIQEQVEPSSGLVTKFADLATLGVHERLVNAITEGMGYADMTKVQSATINPALLGKDLVAQAKTGTGKTLAFLVPVVQRILAHEPDLAHRSRTRPKADDIRTIIISPTRELAEQIGEEARKLVRGTGLVVQVAVGGTQKRMMLQKTRHEGCHILIATPGRLNDLLSDHTSGIGAPNLAALVLDEADRMLEQGFEDELEEILRSLPSRQDVPRQTLLYSATIPKNVVGLARKYINGQNFEFVQTVASDETPTHDKIPQYIVPCKGFENVYPTLLELVQREIANSKANSDVLPFKPIVFLPTTASVKLAASMFRRLAYHDKSIPAIIDIHSKLEQSRRTRAADDFKRAKSAILFSSDVTARGMDFPNVSHVIQVHTPPDREQYIHRLGRTGRAGKEGQGWLLVGDLELATARERLPGLPIKRSTDLSCASLDATSPDAALPDQFEQIKSSVSRLPSDVLQEAYQGYLGYSMRGIHKQDLVDAVNDLAKFGWGLDQPPSVGPNFARNFGRSSGLRVEEQPHRPRESSFGGRGFGDRDGGRGGGSWGGRERGGDAFDQIASQDRRGDSRSRGFGGGGGGSRGFGGGSRSSGGSSRGSRGGSGAMKSWTTCKPMKTILTLTINPTPTPTPTTTAHPPPSLLRPLHHQHPRIRLPALPPAQRPPKIPWPAPARLPALQPPLFDRSADLITIKTSAPYLSASAAALAALIRAQCSIPPKPQLHIVGRRASGSRVDFAIKLNLMSLILPEEQKQQRMDYMRCVAPGEPALRGGSKPSTEPSVGGDGGGGLDEWARRYVDDTTGGSKSFALERVVVNMDVDWLEGQVRSLVASTGYKGVVAVSFPVTHARVVVQSPDRVNKFFTSVTTMFTGKRRYEVVKAVWPFATARNGEAGRRCAVMSEEAWWREWKESVRYAIVTKRQGWVTIEDKLEVIMEGVGRDTPVVDWGPEY
ncbi:P-loop containing nucleoside triphosphate hydrolase protein [Bombardia bombarda]|uniref:ATP-dependent RNA helicase n=1 Tax=Bombardia bombarda TaxID=252184 RepID=A0AA39XMS7_9PEZI|nr:P-loop containing nucleoside triphosphate hydrolase protein [Bombardia bombarda]